MRMMKSSSVLQGRVLDHQGSREINPTNRGLRCRDKPEQKTRNLNFIEKCAEQQKKIVLLAQLGKIKEFNWTIKKFWLTSIRKLVINSPLMSDFSFLFL